MKVKYYSLVGLALCFLTACATNNIQYISTIKESDGIVVVSLFKDDFNNQGTGYTMFHNSKIGIPVNEWDVNGLIESTIREELKHRYSVITDNRFRNLFKKPASGLSGYPNAISNKSKAALNLAMNLSARYILIVAPMELPDSYYQTNQYIEGYGLYHYSGQTIQYVYMEISLFDAATGDFIATNHAVNNDGKSLSTNHTFLGHNAFRSNGLYSEEQFNRIKKNNNELMTSLIKSSLKFMNFTQG